MTDFRDPWCQLSILANLGIVAGYLLVPMTALRLLPMQVKTRIAGIVFFVTCATTHAFMAFAGEHGARGGVFWLMLVNHVVQAIAVWAFVLGLASEIRSAVGLRRQRWTQPAVEVRRDRASDGQ